MATPGKSHSSLWDHSTIRCFINAVKEPTHINTFSSHRKASVPPRMDAITMREAEMGISS